MLLTNCVYLGILCISGIYSKEENLMNNFADKLLNKKNAIAILTLSIAESIIMLFVNAGGADSAVDVPIIMLSIMSLCSLKQLDEPKKFQCLPAFLLFYINLARIACSLKNFNNTAGIIVMIPVVIGGIYTVYYTVKLWAEFFKANKNRKGGSSE